MSRLATIALACTTLAASGPAAADDAWQEERGRWLETIEPGARVRVNNPWGDVYARFGGFENRVEVLATLQYAPGEAPRPAVRLDGAGGGLEVSVEVASGDGPAREVPPTSERKEHSRADLVIFVPQHASFDVETTAGRIEIKGLEGAVGAASRTGPITIRSVHGPVDAKSERGSLSVALETGATARPQAFSTETGDIEVYLWEDADAVVQLATSGEITTDFSIEIEHDPTEEPGKRARATIGDGSSTLSLTSKRGRIRLLRLQKGLAPAG